MKSTEKLPSNIEFACVLMCALVWLSGMHTHTCVPNIISRFEG